MGWLKLEHALDKVLKFLREITILALLVLAVSLPEKISSICGQHFVEWIFGGIS